MARKITWGTAAAFGVALIVSGCGTPQENCIRTNTHELRVVEGLLAQTEANLARGYAWEERDVTRSVWTDCVARRRNDAGEVVEIIRPCMREVTDTERYRVPIDPAAETRKRDNLAAKRDELRARAAATVEACKARYPEEG